MGGAGSLASHASTADAAGQSVLDVVDHPPRIRRRPPGARERRRGSRSRRSHRLHARIPDDRRTRDERRSLRRDLRGALVGGAARRAAASRRRFAGRRSSDQGLLPHGRPRTGGRLRVEVTALERHGGCIDRVPDSRSNLGLVVLAKPRVDRILVRASASGGAKRSDALDSRGPHPGGGLAALLRCRLPFAHLDRQLEFSPGTRLDVPRLCLRGTGGGRGPGGAVLAREERQAELIRARGLLRVFLARALLPRTDLLGVRALDPARAGMCTRWWSPKRCWPPSA